MAYRNIPHEVRIKATIEVVIINPSIEEMTEKNNVSVSLLEL